MRRTLFSIFNLFVFVFFWNLAHAQEVVGEVVEATGTSNTSTIYLALAAAFTISVAAFAGAFAQSRAASSALEGIARNPEAASKIVTPMIIALALIESLVIYALVIAFLLQGKI